MRRRILLILALALLVSTAAVTVVGVAYRAEGEQLLTDTLARHDAAGYGTSAADLAAMAPPVDPDRQARLRVWMKAVGRHPSVYRTQGELSTRLNEGASLTSEERAAHDAFRPEMEALEALFDEGDVCLTSLGWLPTDLESASVAALLGSPIPNLLRMRSAWNWYGVEAMQAADPRDALARLERVHESVGRAGCLIDSMIAVACDAMRDDTYVRLALTDRCPPARLSAWLDEPPRATRLVADGLRGERLRFGAPLAQALAEGESLASVFGGQQIDAGSWDIWDHSLRPWAKAAGECALHLEAMVAMERFIRGEIDRAESATHIDACEDLGYPFSLMLPSHLGVTSAISSSDRHRLVRAAVALARGIPSDGPLPRTDAEAFAWLRDHHPSLLPAEDSPAFRYHRLSESRFRVTTNLDDKGTPLRAKDHDAGRPLVLRHDLVEVQIP